VKRARAFGLGASNKLEKALGRAVTMTSAPVTPERRRGGSRDREDLVDLCRVGLPASQL